MKTKLTYASATPCFAEILFLSANEFTGPIPTSIGMSSDSTNSTLRGLSLSENKLEGSIPESVCNYTNLEALFLDENRLSSSIPSCIGNLENLRQLVLFKNNLTGEIPTEISSLRQLCKYLRCQDWPEPHCPCCGVHY